MYATKIVEQWLSSSIDRTISFKSLAREISCDQTFFSARWTQNREISSLTLCGPNCFHDCEKRNLCNVRSMNINSVDTETACTCVYKSSSMEFCVLVTKGTYGFCWITFTVCMHRCDCQTISFSIFLVWWWFTTKFIVAVNNIYASSDESESNKESPDLLMLLILIFMFYFRPLTYKTKKQRKHVQMHWTLPLYSSLWLESYKATSHENSNKMIVEMQRNNILSLITVFDLGCITNTYTAHT